jgi:hypothetical protein
MLPPKTLPSCAALLVSLACGSTLAQTVAPAPTAAVTRIFGEYTGLPTTTLGAGGVNIANLFWLYESRGLYGGQTVDSWLLFFNPAVNASVSGTVSFAQDVLMVLSTQADLQSTAGFQNTGYTYDYKPGVGTEATDATSFAGRSVTLNWNASDPGDTVRVFTAVPEVSSLGLLAAGLTFLGARLARRRRDAAGH